MLLIIVRPNFLNTQAYLKQHVYFSRLYTNSILYYLQRFVNKTADFIIKFEKEVRTEQMEPLQRKLVEETESWRKVPLRIAVIGPLSCGKTGFINSIRGMACDVHQKMISQLTFVHLLVDGNGWANNITEHVHPVYTNLSFWDLPEVGAPNFPKGTYLKQIDDIGKFDIFMILSADKFTENDKWLANEIHTKTKTAYFVRTKVDINVKDNKNLNRDASLRKVRESVASSVLADERYTRENPHCFLVSNDDVRDFDFPQLFEQMTYDVTSFKRTELAHTLMGLTEDHLKQKYGELQKRLKWAALKSSAFALIPLPLAGTIFDATQINKEIKLYKQHFGTDDITINLYISRSGISFKKLLVENHEVANRVGVGLITLAGGAALNSVFWPASLIRGAFTACTTGANSLRTLSNLLSLCYEEARLFHNAHAEWLAKRK